MDMVIINGNHLLIVASSAPISLTNLQVAVGGVNQLQSTLNYTDEKFIEQIDLAEVLI
jgi:hypothetical protein